MDLDYHSWSPLSGHRNWYLLGLIHGNTGDKHTACCWRLKTRLLLFLPPKHVAHIISSPTTLKTWSHLEQGAGTYYSGTQAWNYRICVCREPAKCVPSCLCTSLAHRNQVGNYSRSNLMKTLFIWCYSLSYQSVTGYQTGWWIVFPLEKQGEGGTFSLSAVRSAWAFRSAVTVSKCLSALTKNWASQ